MRTKPPPAPRRKKRKPTQSEFQPILDLVKASQGLALRALDAYAPAVDSILARKSKDVHEIELTLDYMLDFCFDSKMLLLYKKLCRYYYGFNPQAAASYVHAYREMWDSEEVS